MPNAYCYDGSNSQLLSVRPTSCTTSGGSTFSYDANGDRTGTTNVVGGGTVNSYGYNQQDQLISFSQGSSTASYAYDGTGLRTSKTVGRTTEGFVWDVAEGMPTILQDGTTRRISGPSGLPIEQVDGSGTTQYYLQDQLGSTRGLLDRSGNVVGTYSFDAYGALKGHGGTASTPFGYAGQYTDSESGLEYLRARYYDPSTQQFLTMDPLAGMTRKPYGYAGGNPPNVIDPTGLYGYSYSFDLGSLGPSGPQEAMSLLQSNFGVWPFSVDSVTGKTRFEVGGTYNLATGLSYPQPCGGFVAFVSICLRAGTNPIRVLGMSDSSLSFLSLPGHSEGAGDTITFSTCVDALGHTRLQAVARGPTQWYDYIPGVQGIRQRLAAELWSRLAGNLKGHLSP